MLTSPEPRASSVRPAGPRRPRAFAPGGRVPGSRARSGRGTRADRGLVRGPAARPGSPRGRGETPPERPRLADLQAESAAMSSPPTLTATPRGEAGARAIGAGPGAPPATEEDADVHLVRLLLEPAEKSSRRPGNPCSGSALDDRRDLFRFQPPKRDVGRNAQRRARSSRSC